MDKKTALYARVSTDNQELENQKQKLENWAEKENLDYKLFSEKVSSIKERPEFEKIMDNLDQYDLIAVTKIDRFARSIQNFNQRMELLKSANVEFKAIDQSIDTTDELYGDFFMKLLALFAELERKMIRRRLEEGFQKALKEGRVGRPRALTSQQEEWCRDNYSEYGSISTLRAVLVEKFGLSDDPPSKSAVYRAVKRGEE